MILFEREYVSDDERRNFTLRIFRMDDYIPPTFCHNVELSVVLAGRLRLYANGTVYDFSAKDMYALNPVQSYSMQVLEGPCYVMQLSLAREVFGNQIHYWFGNSFLIYSNETTRDLPEYRFLRYYFTQIYEDVQQSHVRLYQLELNGILTMIQTHLIKHFTKIQNMPIIQINDPDEEVRIAMSYTSANFQRDLTLEEIAGIAGKNRSYFSTYFKKQVGFGWYSYLTFLRLRHAVVMLNDTEENLVDIALSSGFYDSKSFFTAFKRNLVISPKEYRQVNALRESVSRDDDFGEAALQAVIEQYKKEGP